jgi:putative oxidoreductase
MRESLLLGRILFALIFLMSGFSHFSDVTIAYAAGQGVPYAGFLVPFSGLLAVFGGLSILFGYKAKIGAWALVLFLVPVTLKMHAFWTYSDPATYQLMQIMFMKNLSMLGGALTFAYFGAGPYSIDSRVARDETTDVGANTAFAGTVVPSSLRREDRIDAVTSEAIKANEASRLGGLR